MVDGGNGRFDETLEQVLDLSVQPAVLDGYGSLPSQRPNQFHLALAVLQNVRIGVGVAADVCFRGALSVYQLKHSYDLVSMVLHRDDEHGLRPVAVLSIKGLVERVRLVGRDVVSVRDGERLPR